MISVGVVPWSGFLAAASAKVVPKTSARPPKAMRDAREAAKAMRDTRDAAKFWQTPTPSLKPSARQAGSSAPAPAAAQACVQQRHGPLAPEQARIWQGVCCPTLLGHMCSQAAADENLARCLLTNRASHRQRWRFGRRNLSQQQRTAVQKAAQPQASLSRAADNPSRKYHAHVQRRKHESKQCAQPEAAKNPTSACSAGV